MSTVLRSGQLGRWEGHTLRMVAYRAAIHSFNLECMHAWPCNTAVRSYSWPDTPDISPRPTPSEHQHCALNEHPTSFSLPK